jgi:uncharacterized protein (UPF0147 family)
MIPRVINDLVPSKERLAANSINPLLSRFSADDTLASCANVIGELGELISIANSKDQQCPLGNRFHLYAVIKVPIEFEPRAGNPA